MSIEWIKYRDVTLLYMNFNKVIRDEDKLEHIKDLNAILQKEKQKVLVLVNLKGFMPCPGFMELATNTLKDRSDKIMKAAYLGLDDKNMKMFTLYDKYNFGVVNRKNFDEEEKALLWLITSSENDKTIII